MEVSDEHDASATVYFNRGQGFPTVRRGYL